MFNTNIVPKIIIMAASFFMVPIFSGIGVAKNNKIVVPRDFSTIQGAVDVAMPGDTIQVRRGTYTEEIVIAKDLTIEGAGLDKTIIQAPAQLTPFGQFFDGSSVAALVRITDGALVHLSGLTVTGPFPCEVNGGGIIVVKDATLKLEDAHITRTRPESESCPSGAFGRGIVIGLPDIIVQDDGEVGSIGHGKIRNVTVDQFQAVGITVVAPFGGPPSTAKIFNNLVIGGASPFFPVAQIGIHLAAESFADVSENIVMGNTCTEFFCGSDLFNEAQGIGIFTQGLSAANGSEISENFVSENDVGIYQFASPDCCTISENILWRNPLYGIVIQDGDGTTSENIIVGGQAGIAVVASFENTVGVLNGDKVKKTSGTPVQELECCGFTATAIVNDDHGHKH